MKLLQLFQRKIKLPTELADFDVLVDRVCAKYKLTDRNHAAAVISVAIRHLPNEQGYTTLDYLGHSVIKALANYVANYKAELMRHEDQVRIFFDRLVSNPNDMEARDKLQVAADQGSAAAKAALDKLVDKQPVQLAAVVANPDQA